MLQSSWRRLAGLFRREQLATDLDEEIREHLDFLRQQFEDEGHTPAEARRLARIRLGTPAAIRERSQDEWRFGALEGILLDVRFAARGLLRRPGFAMAAIATLALGIGASTAIFSVAYGVALRPLPYPRPDRLIRIYEANPGANQLRQDVSIGAFAAWREGAGSIESAALVGKGSPRFLAARDDAPVMVVGVSPSFFDVLGVRPIIGSGFRQEQEYTRFTADDEGVLSYEAWQRLFGGRPEAVGASLEFTGAGDNDTIRVVGVMPRGFAFGEPVDLWRPTKLVERPVPRLLRNWRYDRVVARLRPDATIERARAELEAVGARLAREFPTTNAGWTVTVESLHESIIGAFGRASWLLLAAVGVVLLVACLNVGGLLVARAVARERETAVRAALGAGSWRLIRLWLAEAAWVTLLGGGLGVALAWSGVEALKAAAPPGIPRLDSVAVDLASLLCATLATLGATAVFTIAPVRRRRRAQVADGLRSGSAGAGDSRSRVRLESALTVAQCAGAAVLVVLALMLTRSFIRLTAFDLGWKAEGVVAITVSPELPSELRRPWFRLVQWSDDLVAGLEALPGVQRAAVTTQIPLSPRSYPSTIGRGAGKPAGDGARWPGVQHIVTDGYFEVMDVRLLRGRRFSAADRFPEPRVNHRAGTDAGGGVAVVSEATARTLWPDRDAVGQSLWLPDGDNVGWREVVGVVEDIQFHAVGEAPALHVFLPWTQHTTGNPRLVLRTSGAAEIPAVVAGVVRRTEPGARILEMQPLDALVARATAQSRFTSRLVAAFGVLALVLAAVGIYGTLSYLVTSRLREIGLRLALGAARPRIMAHVLARGLLPALAGGVLGLLGAVALARLFRALLFGIAPLDPWSFAGGAAVMATVAALAALGPARRAARIDPVRALRLD